MTPILLADSIDNLLIPAMAIGGGILIMTVGIVTAGVRSVMRTRHQEQTRREVAAYVAEGSMSSDDAAKILRAGQRVWDKWGGGGIS